MLKVATLVGSIRKDSYNHKLAEFIRARYNDTLDIRITPIHLMPHYNPDTEQEPPEPVKHFKDQLTDVDAFLIVTAEYNHSIPGVLKNALDWLSRGNKEMEGKPTFIAGASMGNLGTVRAQMHLRQIMNAPGMGARVIPGNEILIGQVQHKVDEHGYISDDKTIEFIDSVVNSFISFANKDKQIVKP